MEKKSRDDVANLIGDLIKSDVESSLKYQTKAGANGVEITLQVPRNATNLADHVKKIAMFMVDDAV